MAIQRIYRSVGSLEAEGQESRRISGYAIVFDSLSRPMVDSKGTVYYEKISRDAISQELIAASDITMNIDHDDSRLLARWKQGEGTLNIELREDGVFFSFVAPDTVLGDEVLYNVRNGNYFECSFAAGVSDDDIIQYREGGQYIEEIRNIKALYDLSIVVRAVYTDTSVQIERSIDDIATTVENIERAQKEAEEAEAKALITRNLDEKLENFYKNINI